MFQMRPERRGAGDRISGVILAGGRATRMRGRDKGLLPLAGKPLVAYAIDALGRQAGLLMISANRHLTVYRQFGYPVIEDTRGGFEGPLAGIASCMEMAKTELVLCVPCDCLSLPDDLADRLYEGLARSNADICVAEVNGRLQPLYALLKTGLAGSLRTFMSRGGRKTGQWYLENRLATVDYSDRPEAFININTAEDFSLAAARLGTPG